MISIREKIRILGLQLFAFGIDLLFLACMGLLMWVFEYCIVAVANRQLDGVPRVLFNVYARVLDLGMLGPILSWVITDLYLTIWHCFYFANKSLKSIEREFPT